MKLDEQESNVITNAMSEAFSIGDEKIIMNFLRKKIYSDPIKAVCREIACNARDAHREVGKHDIPIEIIFPNGISDNFLRFIDHGPGISEDRMYNIFIKYGNSTKRDSNEETGGFGLGAKSPFAYTDTFQIITITNDDGVHWKRTYIAFVDETDAGKLSKIHEEITNEPCGTIICIPINDCDRTAFKARIMDVVKWWDVKPIWNACDKVKQITTEGHEIAAEGNGWKLIRRRCEPRIIIDGIEYELNKDVFDTTFIDTYNHMFNNGFFLHFNTGELSLSVSRDSLDYNKKTVETLKHKIVHVTKEARLQFNKKIELMSPLYFINSKFYKTWRGISLKVDPKYKKRSAQLKIKTYWISENGEVSGSRIYSSNMADLIGERSYGPNNFFNINEPKGMMLYCFDSKNVIGKVRTIAKHARNVKLIEVICPSEKSEKIFAKFTQEEIAKYCIRPIDHIPITYPQSRSKSKSSGICIVSNSIEEGSLAFNKSAVSEEIINKLYNSPKKQGIYISSDFDEVNKKNLRLAIEDRVRVYSFTKKNKIPPTLISLDEWVELKKQRATRMVNIYKNHRYDTECGYMLTRNLFYILINSRAKNDYRKLLLELYKKCKRTYESDYSTHIGYQKNLKYYLDLCELFGYKNNCFINVKDEVFGKYPMLQFCEYIDNKDERDIAVDYVNLVKGQK